MASLYDYIPRYPMRIRIGTKYIEVRGIFKFEINVERCKANYSVWTDTVQVEPLLPSDKKNTILLTPLELIRIGTLVMPNVSLLCNLTKLSYISRRHGYVVDLDCLLEAKFLTKFKYVEPGKEKKEEIGRFDLMELE